MSSVAEAALKLHHKARSAFLRVLYHIKLLDFVPQEAIPWPLIVQKLQISGNHDSPQTENPKIYPSITESASKSFRHKYLGKLTLGSVACR